VLKVEGIYFDAVILCGKRQKDLKGIPICLDGMCTYPFDTGKILAKELMETT
jgi:hypothetical protein